jgi:hypothetical protein
MVPPPPQTLPLPFLVFIVISTGGAAPGIVSRAIAWPPSWWAASTVFGTLRRGFAS